MVFLESFYFDFTVKEHPLDAIQQTEGSNNFSVIHHFGSVRPKGFPKIWTGIESAAMDSIEFSIKFNDW